MQKLHSILFAILICTGTYGQSFNWLTEIKSNDPEGISGTVISKTGDVIITGYIDPLFTVTFGNVVPPSTYATISHETYYTAKCDSSGNFQWVRVGGGGTYNRGTSVVLDDNDNVYSSGFCSGNASFDSINLGYPPYYQQALLLKYDGGGNIKWAKRFGGVDGSTGTDGQLLYMNGYLYNFVNVWTADPTYEVYSQVIQNNPTNGQLSYLAKFDTSGNFILASKIGEGDPNFIIRDVLPLNGHMIVTGFFKSSVLIDTILTSIPTGKYQSFIAKYDSIGQMKWFKKFSLSNSTSFVLGLDSDNNQDILATGVYNDTLIVNSDTLINPSSNYYNSFLCRLDSNGNLLWIKDVYGPGDINCVTMTHNQNRIYVSGYYAGTLNLGSVSLSNPNGYTQFILEFDQSGNFIQAESNQTSNYVQVNAMGIANDKIYVTGQYADSTTIGPYDLYCYPGWGNTDGFIFKYDPIGMSGLVSLEVPERTIQIFPNPFRSQTTLRIDKFFQNASLTVYNSVGQTVKRIDNLTGQTIVFHRDNLPSGLYFVRLTQDGKTISADKFVIVDE